LFRKAIVLDAFFCQNHLGQVKNHVAYICLLLQAAYTTKSQPTKHPKDTPNVFSGKMMP